MNSYYGFKSTDEQRNLNAHRTQDYIHTDQMLVMKNKTIEQENSKAFACTSHNIFKVMEEQLELIVTHGPANACKVYKSAVTKCKTKIQENMSYMAGLYLTSMMNLFTKAVTYL